MCDMREGKDFRPVWLPDWGGESAGEVRAVVEYVVEAEECREWTMELAVCWTVPPEGRNMFGSCSWCGMKAAMSVDESEFERDIV